MSNRSAGKSGIADSFESQAAGSPEDPAASGHFVDFKGERCFVIHDVDLMRPFLMSIVSHDDHWLFCASNGGLTAGRESPETALFPYVSVDKVYDSAGHTGPTTIFKVARGDIAELWQPWAGDPDRSRGVRRSLYKSLAGNRIWFEEINHGLDLVFRYGWAFSASFGFIRECELVNLAGSECSVELVDGLQNILPAGTPRRLQAQSSNLVDAYKWNELDEPSGLAVFSLYSGISDKPEPLESLGATTVFGIGLENSRRLLSTDQLRSFRGGAELQPERLKTGIRGAYLVTTRIQLQARQAQQWSIVANPGLDQVEIVALRNRLGDTGKLAQDIEASVARGRDQLIRIVAGFDGCQKTGEEHVSAHHYANVLFNVLRGGAFVDHYQVDMDDFRATVKHFNRAVYERKSGWLDSLADHLPHDQLLAEVERDGDPLLARLCREYLPLTFGRRHGDPSRPWNEFSIRLRDDAGRTRFYYQGNWRDIFQNWEAEAWNYPLFVAGMIARFVNASTMDGHNPYRISKDGIDWEIEDPEDPWSFIGYWGDHQIIYLLKLLEFCDKVFPGELRRLLFERDFCYANVPYRIRPFQNLLADPKQTIDYDHELAEQIERRVAELGMDGQLVMDGEGSVYLVPLVEKLLVALLAKLANLVAGGGIWMNTQRPEWNDANNALVGYGLSVVTLCYLRRYMAFLRDLLRDDDHQVGLSVEVADWLDDTLRCFQSRPEDEQNPETDPQSRFRLLEQLGVAASDYRQRVYRQNGFSGQRQVGIGQIRSLLDLALAVVDRSIRRNRRPDELFHAYNLLELRPQTGIGVDELYPMLEGQVAALSCGLLSVAEMVRVLDALYASDLYRSDQDSFLLYPDRSLPGFFERNRLPPGLVAPGSALERRLVRETGLLVEDGDGNLRFDAALVNQRVLVERLAVIEQSQGSHDVEFRDTVVALYEQVFRHKSYTGRSGAMFGFEGLGSVYWHMVGKLLLAVQEGFFAAIETDRDEASAARLGEYYYRIRAGLGFNKSPTDYGAFPFDPYSHTPRHAGAQQPGMTGQVKEEIIARFGELGIRLSDGRIHLRPRLLRSREFVTKDTVFSYVDESGRPRQLDLPAGALAFTYCQVPVVYRLAAVEDPYIEILDEHGVATRYDSLELPAAVCRDLFHRSGRLAMVSLYLSEDLLFGP